MTDFSLIGMQGMSLMGMPSGSMPLRMGMPQEMGMPPGSMQLGTGIPPGSMPPIMYMSSGMGIPPEIIPTGMSMPPGMLGMPGITGIPRMQGISGMQGGMPMQGIPKMQDGMPGMQGWLSEPTHGCISGKQDEAAGLFPGMQTLQYLMPLMEFVCPEGMPFAQMVTMPNSVERKKWRREIEELNDKIDELEFQLEKDQKNKKKALLNLNNMITQIEEEKSDLEGQVVSLNNELRKYKRAINDKNDKEMELTTSLQQVTQEYEQYQLQAQNQINAAMRNTQGQTRQDPDPMINLSIFQDGQQNQINKFKNEIKKLEEENQKQKKEIQELPNRREIQEREERISELEQLYETEKSNKRKVQQGLQSATTLYEQEKSELEGQVSNLNSQIRKLKRTQNENNDRIQEQNLQLQQMKWEFEEFQIQSSNQLNQAMRTTKGQATQDPDPMINLSIFQDGQQNQLNKLKNEIKKLEEENQKYRLINRREIQEKEERISELEQLLEQEKNNKRRVQQELQNTTTQLEEEKSELEDQVSNLNNQIRKLKRRINQNNDREQELITQLQQMKQEFEEFQQQSQNQLNQLTQLQEKKIQQLSDEKSKMQEELDREHRNFLSATDEVDNKNKQITQLAMKIKDLEVTLENQLRAFRQKNNELSERQFAYNDLQYQNQQLQNQIDQLNKNEQKFKEFLNNKNILSESQIATELKKLQEQSENFSHQQQILLQQYISKGNQEKKSFQKKMEDEIIAFENLQKGQQKDNL